jgi:carbon storage regulator
MLQLTRKVGESLLIGEEVHLTILAIRGLQVRLGITAPEAIKIFREEVYLKEQRQKISSTMIIVKE